MDKQKKQVTTTGSADGKTLILANEKQSMAAGLGISHSDTGAGVMNTSIAGILSDLQTTCFDLRAAGCVAILAARKNRVYVVIELPASIGVAEMIGGHLTIDKNPVVSL